MKVLLFVFLLLQQSPIEDILMSELRTLVKKENVKDGTWNKLEGYVIAGAKQMESQGRTTQQDIEEAKQNLQTLITGVLYESELAGRYPETEKAVNNKAFSRSAFKLCPLWPFCE